MYTRRLFPAIYLAILSSACLAQPAKPAQPAMPTQAAAPAKIAPASSSGAPPMTAPQVIQVLDQTIDWYRTLGIQQQAASEPSDLLILYDNRQAANRVMALAFEIGRANAELLAKQPSAPSSQDSASVAASLIALQNKFTAQGAAVCRQRESEWSP